MNRKGIVVTLVLLFAALVCGVAFCTARMGHCAYCYQGPCYNSGICGSGCVCMRRTHQPGVCVSFNHGGSDDIILRSAGQDR